jgi:uncharacterized membrane protein (UPF0182 family)
MGETLDAALAGLLAQDEGDAAVSSPSAVSTTETTPSATVNASLSRRALEHYERARAAQRADDWATYGEEMRKLGEVLREIEQQQGVRP